MEIRHLKYFVALAEELHFGRAAERLGIAQPPLSQQLQALERELGTALLSRENKRKVELTRAGRFLLERAKRLLVDFERTRQDAMRFGRGEHGMISIGFIASALNSGKLSAALRRMRASHPGVGFSLNELSSSEIYETLCEGRLDLGILRPSEEMRKDRELIVENLLEDRLTLAIPKQSGHCPKAVALSKFKNEAFIMIPRALGSVFYDATIKMCLDAGFFPNVVQEVHSVNAVMGLVAGGLGVAIVPASACGKDGVACVNIKGLEAHVSISTMRRKDCDSPALSIFLKELKGSR